MQSNLYMLVTLLQAAEESGHGTGEAGPVTLLEIISTIPFIAILLCIAVIPLVKEHWWESNKNKGIVAGVLGIPMAAIYLISGLQSEHFTHSPFAHTAHEYISFICLLGALFIISGGIHIKGSFAGSPLSNGVIILIGSVIASFIGTTGAAVVLIRPLLKSILWRRRPHVPVIFFIFLVANIGGLLTPLGDPPLFLGFLHGVPFEWTFRLWAEWAFMIAVVLAVYLLFDSFLYKQDLRDHPEGNGDKSGEAIAIEGGMNFIWVGGVLCATAFAPSSPWRELGYILMALLAWYTTLAATRERNQFTFHPIIEVAVLFAGIFACMIPCLQLLEKHGSELGMHSPSHFFWATGILSSFLDNAPTYLTFFYMAKGFPLDAALEVAETGVMEHFLIAISLGAVFMGANTYIGNAPNFMVKAIAEEWRVKMPSFFGYMAWSFCILIPLFVLVNLLFIGAAPQ